MASTRPETSSLIERLVRRARRVMLFERLWPAVVMVLATLALFVAVSWLGLWAAVPRGVRGVGLLVFAAGLALAMIVGLRGMRVSRGEALRRLDRDSGLPHRPLSASEDRLANASDDPVTQALWERSRRQIEDVARGLRVAPPSPRLAERDPFALRTVALLALVAAGFVAGPEKEGLIGAAFDWRGAGPAAASSRVDIWIDPPGYTGRPPVVLSAARSETAVTAPVHSTIVVRVFGTSTFDLQSQGGIKPAEAKAPPATGEGPAPQASGPPGQIERRLTLESSGTLTVSHDGASVGPLALTAVPDQPPTIALLGTLAPSSRGGFTLGYRIGDDYGVTGAAAAFADPVPPDEARLVRSLVPPPQLTLGLPAAPGGLGTGQTTGDLSDHPWAGAEVTLVLSAQDEGGNTGLSAPVRVTLPARPFGNPLARALVEQRRNLVFDPDHREPVGLALDALMIEPDQFGTSKAVYLGLYTARQRLTAARNDADLTALADYLWQIALKIEDGDRGQAARDLKAAEQALREALQRGAPPEEIKRLAEAMKQAMDKLMAEMQQADRPEQQGRLSPDAKVITPQQLQDMMKRMQEMAEKGDTAGAQRMLDQLQALLDNLRTAKRSPGAEQATREMNRQMNELDKMTREQQGLRDQTFKQGRDGRPPESGTDETGDEQTGQQDGRKPDDGAGGEDLQGRQGGLRQRLQDLQKSMRQLGLRGEPGLEEAEGAMKDAEGALGQGKGGNRKAVEAQGRALQGLQKGAGGMAQQMAQGQSDETGEGQGQGGPTGQGRSGENGTDPLGRRREGKGSMEVRGNAIDEGVAARAQQVLQELRKRLANPNRPTDELDYLERLLQSN